MPDPRVKRLLLVFGTRPEAIKMAPLVMELTRYRDLFETRVCVTAQHRAMLDQVMDFFDIKPGYDLDLMRPSQDHSELAASVLSKIGPVFDDFNPDLVLIQGDTTTALASALAAFYRGIRVGHVEAGLRTWNMRAPFPEEMNRQVISRITRYHFAPTEKSKENLLREGIDEDAIVVTGNTVVDALKWTLDKATTSAKEEILDVGFRISGKPFILVTGHRRENLGEGIDHICEALTELAKTTGHAIIYPVHLNPEVHDPVYARLQGIDGIHLIPPVSYPAFVWLMQECSFILTDSGGIQEEAPALGKMVLVMRDVTERPEALETGLVRLVGTEPSVIVEECKKLITTSKGLPSESCSPFGDGSAALRIVNYLKGL